MPSAALAIAYGRAELLVANRSGGGLEPVYRSTGRLRAGAAATGTLECLRMARALGARDVATVVVPNGGETAISARLALTAGGEVRLLRGADERALVYAGATLGLPTGTPATVCAIEDDVVDIMVGSAGAGPRWAASIVAAQGGQSLRLAEAVQRLSRLVARLGLPPTGDVLLAGAGGRSLRLALAAQPGLEPARLVELAHQAGPGTLARSLDLTRTRARRAVFAAALAQALEKATRATPGFARGGLAEGALLRPAGLVAVPAPQPHLHRLADVPLAGAA